MAQSGKNLESLEKIKTKQGKRYSAGVKLVREKAPSPVSYDKAIEILCDLPKTKFDETCDVAFRLGVDPKQSDQMVRGACVLPHGTGRSAKVVVFAKGEKAKEAEAAGADEVGAEDLADKISGGYSDFTAVVATPDMMAVVSKVARVLGPKGLMPNPKLGTVTMNLKSVIEELKKGRVEYRVDKNSVIHAPFGKRSFGKEKLTENLKTLTEQVVKAKPATAKGHYLLSMTLSTSMGPGVKVDQNQVLAAFQ